MTARRLFVLIKGLPPESATFNLSRAQEPAQQPDSEPQRHLAPVRVLSDIPVAKSMGEVGKFVQARGDDLAGMMGDAG